MIQRIKSPYPHILIYDLEEFISQYEIEIIDKDIEQVLKNFNKVSLMIYVNIKGENIASMIKEFQLGIKYWNKIHKIAYIGEHKNWKTLVAIDDFFTKFKEKYFELDETAKAWDWLNH